MSPVCVQPCTGEAMGIIIDLGIQTALSTIVHTLHKYGTGVFWYCASRLVRSNRAGSLFRQALRILLRALAAETLGAGRPQEWQFPGLQFEPGIAVGV